MKKLLMLAICHLFVLAMVLGSVVLGQPALASTSALALSQPTSGYFESLNTERGWLVAQASDTEEVPAGATLDDEAPGFKCTQPGFFPSPSNCKQFVRCVDDPGNGKLEPFFFDCAPGTDLWCQELLTCAFDYQYLLKIRP